jgi:hypothetical protein
MTLRRCPNFLWILLYCCLNGCIRPQIITPMSMGFSPNEYLAVGAKTKNRLGQLYEAIQETDKKGNVLPLRWQEVPMLLFPQGAGFNEIEETPVEQTRYAIETSGSSGMLTFAAFAYLEGQRKSAFKYQSKSTKMLQLKLPFEHNPHVRDYMVDKLKMNPNFRFAYLSALYEGSAFVEIFNSIATSGNGRYAAFQIEGDYYTTSTAGMITTGPIIYQLLPVDVDQLSIDKGIKTGVGPKYPPLSSQQLDSILVSATIEVRMMITPQQY